MNQWTIYVYLLFIGLMSSIRLVLHVNGQSDPDIDVIRSMLPDDSLMNPVETSLLSPKHETEVNKNIGYGSSNGSPEVNACASDSPTPVQCDPSSQYRTSDGSCNNLMNPTWGMAGGCHLRLMEPSYDGQGGFRKSVSGGSLPQPRDLSLNIFTDGKNPTKNLSFMYTIFGQLVAHEITLTSMQPSSSPCCSDRTGTHPECANIPVKQNDPFYSHFNVTCLNFERSTDCPFCKNGKRQTMNAVTAALDGSLVYGSNKEIADEIREFDGTGRLKSKSTCHGELLPRPPKGQLPKFCPTGQANKCFLAGDNRVNQHAALTAIQTVGMREHNRIANTLKELNPHWGNEQLYQESRKIFGAQIQSIVYKEYLPSTLGSDHMSKFRLWISPENQGTQYDPQTQLGIWDEFASAVFRMHSVVATNVGMGDSTFKDYFSNPNIIRSGGADPILQGMCKVPSQQFDRSFVNDVSDNLYRQPNVPYGEDLAAADIQRGRDNGMPSYVTLLQFLSEGKDNISSFEDLESMMPPENVMLLKQNYLDVGDIDLWVGIHMENHVPGAIFGPTSNAIVGKQFQNLKYGDRFYFEHEGEVPSFSPAQRESLKQSSFSRLMCDNTDTQTIQMNAFLLPSDENPEIPCNQLPEVNLKLWKSPAAANEVKCIEQLHFT